ncbi:MAG: hypothetical protein LBO66_10860 [Deltaproteobacteria bacterium]|nr:hypothetical protein [Deltaproteobacteria bacterium]
MALALAAPLGRLGPDPVPVKPIIIEAYRLPVRRGVFVFGSTTQDEAKAAIGSPSSIKAVADGQEVWLYYPRRTEIVHQITFMAPKGGSASLKFAPSDGETLSLLFNKGKLVGL